MDWRAGVFSAWGSRSFRVHHGPRHAGTGDGAKLAPKQAPKMFRPYDSSS
jgi:hypothetical protein